MAKLGLIPLNFLTLVVFVGYSESYRRDFISETLRRCPADANEPWTYRGSNGPRYWGDTYPQCNGEMQSPINIIPWQARRDENLAPLELENYDIPISSAKIMNNGHTVQLTPNDGEERGITLDGEKYILRQLHFHWGRTISKGSEHTINNFSYAMEMHLVHINSNDNIAVVGVFFKERLGQNAELQNIVSELPKVMFKNNETKLGSQLNLNNLVPDNPTSYYRYEGSLTTPECSEGVTWSVVPRPLVVGTRQMAEFRKLYSAEKEEATRGCRLSGNYRPLQPLNGRTVFISQSSDES